MKKQTIFLAFAVLMMLGGMVSAQSAYDGSLSMVNVSVSPNPVVAGGNVTIKFQLYSSYDGWLYGATLQPTGSYPIVNVSPVSTYLIGTINGGLNPRNYNVSMNSKYYEFTFKVPNTTQSGTYTITFTSTYFVYASTGTVIGTSSMPVSFYVQNKPSIKVTGANPQPSALYAGYNQTLDIMVQNTGYGTARNVSVTVGAGNGLNILSSVRTFSIPNLTEGSAEEEPLLVSAHSTNMTYLLANVTYYSSQLQQRFSNVQRINVSVAPSAQFAINSSGANPAVGVTDAPIHLTITNTGTSPASELELNLQTPYPVTPLASTAYVNELRPGASANVTFFIGVDSSGVPGNYPVTLYEQWKQPSGSVNQQFTGSNNYYIDVEPASNNGESSYMIDIVAVIIVLVIIYTVGKRVLGGKKKKK
jgi:hypothetical protein